MSASAAIPHDPRRADDVAAPASPIEARRARALAGFDADEYRLLRDMLVHDREQGGTLAQASGLQGCGKTTLLLGIARVLADLGETPIWRGRDIDAWAAFPGPVKLWADHPIEIVRVPFGDDAKPEPFTLPDGAPLPVHEFRGAMDVVARAEPGVLNVVYAREWKTEWDDEKSEIRDVPTRFWGHLTFALTRKPSTRWHALFIDELHEVWGDRPEGEDWHHQREVRDNLADFRKTFNSLFGATHHYDELDDALLKKFQYRVYLRGARIPSWSTIRNKQYAFGLRPGQCVIERGHFAKIAYPPIPKPPFQVIVRPRGDDGDELVGAKQEGGQSNERARALERAPARGASLSPAKGTTPPAATSPQDAEAVKTGPQLFASAGFRIRQYAERREVYESSQDDAQAAQRLSLSIDTFSRWRQRQGLPAKRAGVTVTSPAGRSASSAPASGESKET